MKSVSAGFGFLAWSLVTFTLRDAVAAAETACVRDSCDKTAKYKQGADRAGFLLIGSAAFCVPFLYLSV
jgi:hypothetical protein